ncbi:MAG: methyltransferase domain-containing protein [Candidatus Omnitrophica bacterium]|nr:methyltransferase domain-containing protein [Candidatus Omnitrophota bacterium]
MTIQKTEKRVFTIDDRAYNVEIRRNTVCSSHAVKIIIPAYMPNRTAAEITRVCCESISRFTKEEFELWLVDNRSPARYIKWLDKYPFINVVLNRTEPINRFAEINRSTFLPFSNKIRQMHDGSYANAIGLEIGIRLIAQDTKYVFVMHSDTVVIKTGWLGFLKSKLNDHVKLAAFRKDPARVHALHVGGMLIDYKAYQECGMSFMPNMRQERYPNIPEYDVGDQLTIKAEQAGYGTFVSKNTFNNPELETTINESDPLRAVKADKCFDDSGDVFLMHLGRGVPRSLGDYTKQGKMPAEHWIPYIKRHVLNDHDCKMRKEDRDDLNYSLRRYFVDSFYKNIVPSLKPKSAILDLGGKKMSKRGRFNMENYQQCVEYVNLDKQTDPDYCTDVTSVPLESDVYDAVICAETLEHVYDANKVIREAFRLLKKGGLFLATVPFNVPLHPDPKDYARYTDSFLLETLQNSGFSNIKIEKQGYLLSVISDMVTGYVKNYKINGLGGRLIRKTLVISALGLRQAALSLEPSPRLKYNPFLTRYTTGYGIIAQKPM